MVLIFIVNIALLFLCYQLYIADRMTQSLSEMQDSVDITNEKAVEAINGGDYDEAEQYLLILSEQDDTTFILLDTVSGEQAEIGSDDEANVGAVSIALVTLDGETYMLYAQKKIDVYDLRTKSAIRDVLNLEYIIIFIMLLLTGIALHFRYVRPLMRLKSNINQYDNDNANPPPALPTVYRKDEIGQLEESFAALSKSLSGEKQVQKRIVASISHDIKTPLTSVMGYAERLIKKDFDPEKRKQYLNIIYSQAKDIEAIVSEFDEFIENSTESKLDLKPYGTAFICKMLSDEYVQQLSENGIQVSIENTCEADSVINVDMPKLRRVFANIIGNSIRHANAENLSIFIQAKETEEYVRFTIFDNGQGVPDNELPFLFEPFYTSDKSRRVSGLGLSICQSIVNAHGGRIRASHSQIGGLRILIELPKT
jgi:signal transduction histidine kinase